MPALTLIHPSPPQSLIQSRFFTENIESGLVNTLSVLEQSLSLEINLVEHDPNDELCDVDLMLCERIETQ